MDRAKRPPYAMVHGLLEDPLLEHLLYIPEPSILVHKIAEGL